jgi:protein SCO1/2
MNAKFAVTAITGLAALAAIFAIGFTRSLPEHSSTNRYDVNGRIMSIDPAAKTIRIAHEEIQGYMPAMTMPFEVRDAALLNGIKPGDTIRFRLEVSETDSWISRFEPGSDRQPEGDSASAPQERLPEEFERLEIGETVPDLALIDQEGAAVRTGEHRGKAVLLTFIYTRCPLPNFCPFLSKSFAELQTRLSREFPGRFHLLSITIDPGFDKPGVLKSYAMRYAADTTSWTFATGSLEEIQRAGGWFGLTREATGGLINHDLRTALISPEGKLVRVWKSNAWTPYEVQRSVRETLTGSIDVAKR